jgi:hypothetical protein
VRNSQDYLSDEDDPIIEDLSPATITGVASRLIASDSFEELVYRECELDALWTLADIAIKMIALQETGHAPEAWQALPENSGPNLVTLRALFEQSHELAVDARTEQAAAVLQEAARLRASWS